jgi:AhpD family alkylhydroperoxidase
MTLRIDYQHIAPAGMKALGGVHMYVSACGLPKDLIDLVYLRASQINGCAYCVDSHSHDLLEAGVPVRKLMLVPAWRESGSIFSDREHAALAWCEAVTLVATTHVADDAFSAVRAQFSEKEVADLTIAISLINSYNRIGISFRRGPEPPS